MGARQSTAQQVDQWEPPGAPATRAAVDDATLVTSWTRSSGLQRTLCIVAVLAALATPITAGVPIASALAVAILVPAALVDVHTRRLPDVWIGAGAIAFLVVDAFGRAFGGSSVTPGHLALGTAVMSLPLLLMHLPSPASMGFGDVKLAAVLGAAIGAIDWHLALPALALAAGATATVGVVARSRYVAFGPGLVGASVVALLAHDVLVRA